MTEKIGETGALCPECLKTIKAEKIVEDDDVYIVKTCPDHGTWKVKIWSGAEQYKYLYEFAAVPKTPEKYAIPQMKVCPEDCGLCDKHLQHSCLNVVEVTNRCNLNCPICFATANGCGYDFHPDIETIKGMFQTVVDYVKSPRCVQISGGEPTIRDDLPEIVKLAKEMGIEHIEVNTNAVRIANDMEYLKALKEAGVDDFYFQFDGTDDEIYMQTRGKPMFEIKERAIKNCSEVGIGITLVVTVSPEINLNHVGEIIKFAASKVPTVKGVHFQPIAHFGRYPQEPTDENRVLLPQLASEIEKQTKGMLKADNFIPTSCSNVHCDLKSLSIVLPDGSLFPLTTMALGPPTKTDNVADKTRTEVSQLWKYIEDTMDGEDASRDTDDNSWKTFVSRAKTHYLTVSAMAFQDVWTGETERWERCCIHVVTLDGKLIPFCLFNTTAKDGTTMYRRKTFCR
ncbi:MAG: radical SAM protein [Candidatus Methanomethylophilaceae archaeon]|nr:radical SAM protein [Thermoplasmata archaeon]MBQ2762372.1 radical SAM protein [Candidatus Methanomethylophilaceae archaeon]